MSSAFTKAFGFPDLFAAVGDAILAGIEAANDSAVRKHRTIYTARQSEVAEPWVLIFLEDGSALAGQITNKHPAKVDGYSVVEVDHSPIRWTRIVDARWIG